MIQRITSFKIPKEEDIEKFLDLYKHLDAENQKDGKKYILDIKCRKNYNDARNQGYTVVAMTKFASVEDLHYYDNDCEAHKALKAQAKPLIVAPPLVFYMDEE